MGRVPQLVQRGKKDRRMGEPTGMGWQEIEALEVDARVELIRELIPLGLAEVGRMLDEEVERLAGPRHGGRDRTKLRTGMGAIRARCGWATSDIRSGCRGCGVGRARFCWAPTNSSVVGRCGRRAVQEGAARDLVPGL